MAVEAAASLGVAVVVGKECSGGGGGGGGGGSGSGPYTHLLRSELLSPAASPSSSDSGAISGSSIGHIHTG